MIGESVVIAEQQVLGACLLEPTAYSEVAGIVDEGHFMSNDHQLVYRAMKSIVDSGEEVEPTAVIAGCGDSAKFADLVLELRSGVGSAANVASYAKRVRDAADKRALVRILQVAAEEVRAPALSYAEALGGVQGQIGGLHTSGTIGLTSAAKAAKEVVAEIEAIKAGTVRWLTTGLDSIDRTLVGIRPGEMVVLAAQPGVGKTALSLQIADRAAIDCGARILFYSLEMRHTALMARLLARRAKIDGTALRCGSLGIDETARLDEAISGASDLDGLLFHDRGGVSPQVIMNDLQRESARDGGVGLVVVDHLQLVSRQQRPDRFKPKVNGHSGV